MSVNKMKKRNMRLLSVILSLILVFQVMPAGVFANEISEEEMATVIEEVTETAAEVELVEDETVEEENNEEMVAEVSEEALQGHGRSVPAPDGGRVGVCRPPAGRHGRRRLGMVHRPLDRGSGLPSCHQSSGTRDGGPVCPSRR